MLITFYLWPGSQSWPVAINPEFVTSVEPYSENVPAIKVVVGSNRYVVHGTFEEVMEKLSGGDNSGNQQGDNATGEATRLGS
jgi:hypothetical protein